MADDVFSIQDFIENRWADVKTVLEEIDSAFVHTIEAYKMLESGLTLPSRPRSKGSLPEKWRKVIESTVDVRLAIRDLFLCVELTGSVAKPTTVHWYTETFIEKAYNLVERTKTLVSIVCGAYGLGGLKEKYIAELDSTDVQGRISELRHPRVHGAGGVGTTVQRAIADDPNLEWETAVSIGPEFIDQMLAGSNSSRLTPSEWHEVKLQQVRTLETNIAKVLAGLEDDVAHYVKVKEGK